MPEAAVPGLEPGLAVDEDKIDGKFFWVACKAHPEIIARPGLIFSGPNAGCDYTFADAPGCPGTGEAGTGEAHYFCRYCGFPVVESAGARGITSHNESKVKTRAGSYNAHFGQWAPGKEAPYNTKNGNGFCLFRKGCRGTPGAAHWVDADDPSDEWKRLLKTKREMNAAILAAAGPPV